MVGAVYQMPHTNRLVMGVAMSTEEEGGVASVDRITLQDNQVRINESYACMYLNNRVRSSNVLLRCVCK